MFAMLDDDSPGAVLYLGRRALVLVGDGAEAEPRPPIVFCEVTDADELSIRGLDGFVMLRMREYGSGRFFMLAFTPGSASHLMHVGVDSKWVGCSCWIDLAGRGDLATVVARELMAA